MISNRKKRKIASAITACALLGGIFTPLSMNNSVSAATVKQVKVTNSTSCTGGTCSQSGTSCNSSIGNLASIIQSCKDNAQNYTTGTCATGSSKSSTCTTGTCATGSSKSSTCTSGNCKIVVNKTTGCTTGSSKSSTCTSGNCKTTTNKKTSCTTGNCKTKTSTKSSTKKNSTSDSSNTVTEKTETSNANTTKTETGTLTEEEVYQSIIKMKDKYPEGMRWTNSDYYQWKGGIIPNGYGCVAFAYILSDEAFGSLPARKHTDVSSIKVGDILRINQDTHSVIVLEVNDEKVVVAEGNYNSSIHWGRTFERKTLEKNINYIFTRYPN